jgi:hypothetical protein
MTIPNWTDMQFYHYLIAAGAVVVVAALVLYFTPISRLKVPAILMGIAGGLGVGTALGVIAMGALGYHWEARPAAAAAAGQSPGGMGAGMRRGSLGGPRAGAPGGGGGRGGPNPKNQLVSLITKLDLVTSNGGLKVTMDPEQRRKVREQIQKLEDVKDLSNEDAKAKYDAVLEVLNEEQKKTLTEAGANLGQRGGTRGGGDPPPNPFKEGQANQHLKSLREHMEDKKS